MELCRSFDTSGEWKVYSSVVNGPSKDGELGQGGHPLENLENQEKSGNLERPEKTGKSQGIFEVF